MSGTMREGPVSLKIFVNCYFHENSLLPLPSQKNLKANVLICTVPQTGWFLVGYIIN